MISTRKSVISNHVHGRPLLLFSVLF